MVWSLPSDVWPGFVNSTPCDMITQAEKIVPMEPCTKLQYRIERSTYPGLLERNKATYFFNFGSPFVGVKEQYVVYDLVAMIGAVGGTMGLCIGFSFNDALNFVLSYLQVGVNWMKARVANKRYLLLHSETLKKVHQIRLIRIPRMWSVKANVVALQVQI